MIASRAGSHDRPWRRHHGAGSCRPDPGSSTSANLWGAGHRMVAGIDEVGRGAWAGPLSVGVAVLCDSPPADPRGLRDSKQLTETRREAMFDRVAAWCADWAVGHAGPEECDRLGMTAALRLATRRAAGPIAPPEVAPDAVVLDGTFDFVSPPVLPQLFDAEGGVEPEARAAAPRRRERSPVWAPPVQDVIGGDAAARRWRPRRCSPRSPGTACMRASGTSTRPSTSNGTRGTRPPRTNAPCAGTG